MSPYYSLLVLFGIGALISVGFVIVSRFIGRKKATSEKMMPYECGLDPVEGARHRFSVKFYLIAMLFILFDIEVVFMYPWAKLFHEFKALGLGALLFVEMVIFLGILILGYVYVLKRGALEWEK